MQNQGLMHFFAILSFAGYLIFCISLIYSKKLHEGETRTEKLKLRSFEHACLSFSILNNIVFILLVIGTDLVKHEGAIVFESHPALILLLTSFVLFLSLFIYRPRSSFLVRAISFVSLTIFCLGSVLFHNAEVSQVYELSPLLILHIFVSLVSQVVLILVFVLSFVIVILDRGLKHKTALADFSQYPALVPTESFWSKSVQLAIASFSLSIITGIIQIGGLNFSSKFLISILNFIGLVIAFLFYRFSHVGIFKLTLILGLYVAVLFTFQIMVRSGLLVF